MHGRAEPFCFLFSLGALAVILRAGPELSGRRAGAAGTLFGLAIATQTWPAVFGPALLLALPSWRRRAQFTAGAAGVMALLWVSLRPPSARGRQTAIHCNAVGGVPAHHRNLGLVRTLAGRSSDEASDLAGSAVAERGVDRHQGRGVGALLAVWWWRRAHPLDVATATTTALLALTPSFGNQYLTWQAPSATARPARLSIPLQIVLGAYAAIFYLPM